MPWNSPIKRSGSAYPCLSCNRPIYRDDGHCRTAHCPNRVPDDLIAPAREQALAEMRETIATARQNRTDRSHD